MVNEQIRENIRKMISEAKGTIRMTSEIEHMLTSICFVMYKAGMNDAFKMSIKAIEISQENMKKE